MRQSRVMYICVASACLLSTLAGRLAASGSASNGSISLSAFDTAYIQTFDTLASTGSAVALTLPGWAIDENGTGAAADGKYSAGTGSLNTGDTYSFGSSGSADRALGMLL